MADYQSAFDDLLHSADHGVFLPHLHYVVEEWPSKAAYWADGVLKTLPKL